jgi:ribosomal protein S6
MKYELTIALKPDLAPEKSKKINGEIEESVHKLGGKILQTESLGMKSLAYPIKGAGQASFGRFQLELGPDKIQDLRRQLEREEGVVRVLVIKGGEEEDKMDALGKQS